MVLKFLGMSVGARRGRKRRSRRSAPGVVHLEKLEPRQVMAAPEIITDLVPGYGNQSGGYGSSWPTELIEFKDQTYFAASDASYGRGIFRTDGTAGGTACVSIVRPNRQRPVEAKDALSQLTPAGDYLFFRESTTASLSSNTRLWRTDGTAAGTVLLRDFGHDVANLTNVNGQLFFTVWTAADTDELWRSDGTVAGTVRLGSFANVSPCREFSNINGPERYQKFLSVGGDVYFGATRFPYDRGALIKWDAASQSLVTLMTGSGPSSLTVANGQVHFAVGAELWRTNGTAGGTVRLATVPDAAYRICQVVSASGVLCVGAMGPRLGDPAKVLVVGDSGWSTAYTTQGPCQELLLRPWGADVLVVERDPSAAAKLSRFSVRQREVALVGVFQQWGDSLPYGPSYADYVITPDNRLYFQAAPRRSSAFSYSETELWESDGTTAGTRVYDVAGGWSSRPGYLTAFRGQILYAASTPETGVELWKFRPSVEPSIALSANVVPENRPAGTTVGCLASSTSAATFQLVSGLGGADNDSFHIVGQELRTARPFDYESRSTLSVRVRMSQANAAPVDRVIAVAIRDVNEAPTDLKLSGNYVPENQPAGTTVGVLNATDPDRGNRFSYELVAGVGSDGNSLFRISRVSAWGTTSDLLVTNAALDYESRSEYPVRVRVRDQDGLSFEKTFVIRVTDVAEAPARLLFSQVKISPAVAIGTAVGTLTTVDPDAGDQHTYRLVSGVGSTDNARFRIVDNEVRAAVALDFTTQATYFIRVRSTDRSGLFIESTLCVMMLPDPPTARPERVGLATVGPLLTAGALDKPQMV